MQTADILMKIKGIVDVFVWPLSVMAGAIFSILFTADNIQNTNFLENISGQKYTK